MVYATIKAKDIGIRYDQTNNVVERFLWDLKYSKQTSFWLESCNVCASCCSVEAVNAKWNNELPVYNGKYIIQQDDLMFSFIYTQDVPIKKEGLCENEIPENLVFAINSLSSAKATLHSFSDKKTTVEGIKEALKREHAVIISYLTDYNTGHYICLVEYDDTKKILIAYDSWSKNKHCQNSGVREPYPESFFVARVRPRFIEVEA